MVWSQFSIKILGRYFGNSALDNSNWDKISHSLTNQNRYLEQIASLFEMRKRIVNQILLSKLWYKGQIYTIPKFTKKDIEKTIQHLLWNSPFGSVE